MYDVLTVTNAKVLNLMEEPTIMNLAEEQVWNYLRQFVGNMTKDELRAFLRFSTGSFVICVPSIHVTFNKLQGIARRPISHTCASTLELSCCYSSHPDFESEFRAVLANSNSWIMDSL